jgi:hypothetical protein
MGTPIHTQDSRCMRGYGGKANDCQTTDFSDVHVERSGKKPVILPIKLFISMQAGGVTIKLSILQNGKNKIKKNGGSKI